MMARSVTKATNERALERRFGRQELYILENGRKIDSMGGED